MKHVKQTLTSGTPVQLRSLSTIWKMCYDSRNNKTLNISLTCKDITNLCLLLVCSELLFTLLPVSHNRDNHSHLWAAPVTCTAASLWKNKGNQRQTCLFWQDTKIDWRTLHTGAERKKKCAANSHSMLYCAVIVSLLRGKHYYMRGPLLKIHKLPNVPGKN